MKTPDRKELKIFLTVLLLTGLFIQWYGVNANSRLDLTRSMVDHGSFNTNEVYQNTADRSYYKGDYYSDKEPGMAFLATPIYAGWKLVYEAFGSTEIEQEPRKDIIEINNVTVTYPTDPGGFYLSSLILVTFLTSTVSLSILTLIIYRLSGDFLENERKRLLATFGFSFGTILTHYGTMFMPNAVVTLLSFSSFYIVYRLDSPNFRNLIFAGFLGGFSVVVDPTGFPVLAGTFIYSFLKFDSFPGSYFAGGFLGGLPMMIYNTLIFGLPWMLPRFYLDPELYPNLQQASSVLPQLTEQGFRLGVERLFFTSTRLLFMPYRGIFYWFPFLVLSFFGIREFLKNEKKIAVPTGFTLVSVLFVVAGWWAWWMGGFFGARYLSVAVPFIMFPTFYGIKKTDTRIVALVVGLSIIINLSGFHGGYEDMLKDLENSSEMKEKYEDDVRTLKPLANPVSNYYLPGLIENGPQSRIINGLFSGQMPPDIRAYSDDEKRAPAIIVWWLITATVLGVWRKDILEKLSNHRERVLKMEK